MAADLPIEDIEMFTLSSVEEVIDREIGTIEGVVLRHDKGAWLIKLENEYVTLSLHHFERKAAVTGYDTEEVAIVDQSEHEPWKLLIGREIRMRWRLTNSMGYDDGVCISDAYTDSPRVLMIATFGIDLLVPVLAASRRWLPPSANNPP